MGSKKKRAHKKVAVKNTVLRGFELWIFGTESPELLFEHFPLTAHPEKLHAVSRKLLGYVRGRNTYEGGTERTSVQKLDFQVQNCEMYLKMYPVEVFKIDPQGL